MKPNIAGTRIVVRDPLGRIHARLRAPRGETEQQGGRRVTGVNDAAGCERALCDLDQVNAVGHSDGLANAPAIQRQVPEVFHPVTVIAATTSASSPRSPIG